MAHLITDEDIQITDRYSCKLCRKSGALCNDTPRDCSIVASGREALVRAASSYDGSSPFKNWARINIEWSRINYFREMFGKRNHVEFFKTLEFVNFDAASCWDSDILKAVGIKIKSSDGIKLSVNGTEQKVIWRDLFKKLRDRVTPEQKEYLNMRFIQHMGNDEIAAEKNIKVDRVDNQFWVIRKHARQLFAAV